jgi:hypothetical protein
MPLLRWLDVAVALIVPLPDESGRIRLESWVAQVRWIAALLPATGAPSSQSLRDGETLFSCFDLKNCGVSWDCFSIDDNQMAKDFFLQSITPTKRAFQRSLLARADVSFVVCCPPRGGAPSRLIL